MLMELTTAKGHKFWYESLVTIGTKEYAINEMDPEQQVYLAAAINIKGLNAAFAGERVFSAKLPPAKEVFRELLEGG